MPTDTSPLTERTPVTESYWQQGCDDAAVGNPRVPPNPGDTKRLPWSKCIQNEGYLNGYDFKMRQMINHRKQQHHQQQDSQDRKGENK